MTLVWTKEKPTKPGWYWWRLSVGGLSEIVHIFFNGVCLIATTHGSRGTIEGMFGEWAGPIEPPVEGL